MRILYEDNHIIVCVKPVNMPVQRDETGDPDLLSELKAYVKEKYAKPGEVYLGLVHRLDRPVGGVMVFARTSKAASRLMPQFAQKGPQGAGKRYAALVCGEAPAAGRLEDWLLKDEAERRSAVVPEGTEGAKKASLDFETVSRKNGLALVDVDLHSGRHHQIRAQLSHAGYPIWGDQKYNPAAVPGEQIALFAYSLSLEHPTLRERMTFTALPEGGAWAPFSLEMRLLTCGLRCVYSDRDLLVINKPAGVTVANADGGERTLEAMLESAGLTCYPVHRLDAPTRGLVIFARSESAKAALDEAIRARTIGKTYRLIAAGRPEKPSGTLDFFAVKETGGVRAFDSPCRGSAEMITDYRVLETKGGFSLIEARLVTGRTHQIRASFAHIGCPIVGDDRYGDREVNRSREARAIRGRAPMCLAATDIEFRFPEGSFLQRLNGVKVSVSAPFEL